MIIIESVQEIYYRVGLLALVIGRREKNRSLFSFRDGLGKLRPNLRAAWKLDWVSVFELAPAFICFERFAEDSIMPIARVSPIELMITAARSIPLRNDFIFLPLPVLDPNIETIRFRHEFLALPR